MQTALRILGEFEFEILKKIHGDCKDEISYIGNSNVDGAPIFTYTYRDKLNSNFLPHAIYSLVSIITTKI